MGANDGSGPGDERRTTKKKGSPSARKRAPKAVNAAEENGRTATEREVAPQAEPEPARTQPNAADRSAADARNVGQRTSGERPADLGSADDDGNFGDRDADRAANVAADLKSWLDTRREDRDAPREVL